VEVVQEESFAPIIVVQHAVDWRKPGFATVCQGLAAAYFNSTLRERFLDEAQAVEFGRFQAPCEPTPTQAPFAAGAFALNGWNTRYGIREFYTRIALRLKKLLILVWN